MEGKRGWRPNGWVLVTAGGIFNPLGFGKDNIAEWKLKEIKNARLAMLACAGFFAQVPFLPAQCSLLQMLAAAASKNKRSAILSWIKVWLYGCTQRTEWAHTSDALTSALHCMSCSNDNTKGEVLDRSVQCLLFS